MQRLKAHLNYFILIYIALLISCVNTTIPTVYVNSLDTIEWSRKSPCTITYDLNNKRTELSGKIKYRGGISAKFKKHSYALELSNKFGFADLPADDDWILNASYIDKTFMRHKISYDLFRQMHFSNVASKCAYINLNVDGEDKGLYIIMEEINAAMVGLIKEDSMAMLFKDPPFMYQNRLEFVQDSSNYYQQKYPKKKYTDKTIYIEKFKSFLFYSTDIEFREKINDWVDLDNIIDWHILLLFSNNGDGILKNFYLYKLYEDKPFRIAIWDYDHTFGRDGDNEMNMMERELNCNRSILFKRLLETNSFNYVERLKNRWNFLRKTNIITAKNMNHLIKENDQMIKSHIGKNQSIWPLNGEGYYDDNSYEQEIELMQQFIPLRLKQLDAYFKKL